MFLGGGFFHLNLLLEKSDLTRRRKKKEALDKDAAKMPPDKSGYHRQNMQKNHWKNTGTKFPPHNIEKTFNDIV